MTYGPVPLGDVWGVDCNTKLTPETARALAAATLPNGQPVRFVWRYVPLPGNDARGDIDAAEAAAILDAGLALMLVQHCRAGHWTASAERGAADGAYAAAWAAQVGYPTECHLALDDEAVANPGPSAFAHCVSWCRSVRDGATPCVYVGFDSGLTPTEEYELPDVDRYWAALGPWDIAVRGPCCRQGPTVRVAGLEVDTDHAAPDRLGGVLVAWGSVPDA